MNATVQKWGNSLALRLPRALAQDVHIHQGSLVEVSIVSGKIVVKPERRQRRSLAQLLKGVTKKNIHSELRWGARKGQEVW